MPTQTTHTRRLRESILDAAQDHRPLEWEDALALVDLLKRLSDLEERMAKPEPPAPESEPAAPEPEPETPHLIICFSSAEVSNALGRALARRGNRG